MALKLVLNILQSYPSCSTMKWCDETPDYSSVNTGGYGTPNPAREDITSTKIYVMVPGAEEYKLLESDFIPDDECTTFTQLNLEESDITEIIDTNCCGCPKTAEESPVTEFVDGCWQFKYEVYAAGNCYEYDLYPFDFPNAFGITINSVFYDLGYCSSKNTLLTKLNSLHLGSFTLSGDVITVCSINTFGDIQSSYTVFTDDDALVSYPRQEVAFINSILRDLGSVTSLSNHNTVLNALSLGYWDTSVADFVAFGFSNYGMQAYGEEYYDNSVFSYAATTSSVNIDGVVYPLGSLVNVAQLITKLNLLNLGLFRYDSGTDRIYYCSPFVVTDLTIDAVVTARPDGGVIGTYTPETIDESISPTITTNGEVLVGSTVVNKFFHCHVTNEVRDAMMVAFSEECNCDGLTKEEAAMNLWTKYNTLILASMKEGCNCLCTEQYLEIVQTDLNKINNDCQ